MCCGLDLAANPEPGFFVRPKLDEVAVWALRWLNVRCWFGLEHVGLRS